MEVGVVDKERLLDIVELAMIGAAFPCGFAPAGDVFCEAFRVLLDGREAVCRFSLVGPTSGPDWRAKPPMPPRRSSTMTGWMKRRLRRQGGSLVQQGQ